jgi:glycosyltransferase involved in cell wall biosynthesis
MKNRIILVTNSYSGGGAENSMSLLHKSFIEGGIDSFLLCLNKSEKGNRPDNPMGVIELERSWGDGVIGTLKNFLEFRQKVNSLNARVIVGNCELPELYLSLISLRKYNAICVEHTSNPWFGRRSLGYIVRKALVSKGVSWITVTRDAKIIWPTTEIPRYIPNPINRISNIKKKRHDLKLAYIGRLRAEKRPDWALIAAQMSGFEIDFYGEGPLEQDLISSAKEYGVRATFHGYTQDVWDLVSENTIVIVPSEFEGDGLTVVESIVRGLPIILAENQDLRRFGLNTKCYFRTPTDMGNALKEITSSNLQELRPSLAQIEKYRIERSLDTITETWREVFNIK